MQSDDRATTAKSDRRVTGLRSPGWFARYPLAGLLMFILGSAVLGLLAYNLRAQGPLLQWDMPLANRMHTTALNSPAWARTLMIAGYYVGQHLIVAIGVLLALYFLIKRFWCELAMLAFGLGLEGPLWLVLTSYFNRPRPAFERPVWIVLPVPSFPSGHAFSAVLCYGLLAYLLMPKIASPLGKGLVVALALLIMTFIGVTRLYLGQHYLTDVIAGYALGFGWSGLVYTLVERLFQRWRAGRHLTEGSVAAE